MGTKLMITASTHPAKNNILEYVDYLQKNNINIGMLHVDIMDGVFVEDKTFDYEMVKEISKQTTIPLDCHLMIKEPSEIIDKYIDAGANIVTVHYEAFENKKDLLKTLKHIRKAGCLAGISINPKTRPSEIAQYIDFIDMILVMSVEPGKSGQKFIVDTINKISVIKDMIKSINDRKILIEVDGGINIDTINYVKNLVDMVVCGSALYNSTDKNFLINELTK